MEIVLSHVGSRWEIKSLFYVILHSGIKIVKNSPLHILLMDDEAMLLDLLPMMLEPHQTTICRSLREACQTIEGKLTIDHNAQPDQRDSEIDVMLCDLMMPQGGGLDLYEWLLEHYPEYAKKMIFVTGGVGQELAQRVQDTNQPVLHKPFSIAELHTAIDDFLSQND